MSNGGFFVELLTQSDDVTGSCTLVTVRLPDGNKQQIAVDCGSFVEKKYRDKNETFLFNPKELDACVITHGHLDHIGRLPLLIKRGYRGKIYSTDVTANIVPISLMDSYQIMLRDYRNGNGNNNGNENGNGNSNGNGNGNGNGVILYDEYHVESAVKRLKRIRFDTFVQITPNVKLAFIGNGHLFGAAMVYLKCSYYGQNDINLLFTGDYKKDNQFFSIFKRLPFKLYRERINIIMETTYGNSMSDEIDYIFFEEIIKAVRKKQKILLPAFALGRAQVVFLEICRMQRRGYIPSSYNIYGDSTLMKEYLKLAKQGQLGIEKNRYFLPKNLMLIGENKLVRAQEERLRVIESSQPAIIVSSSGSCGFGPSNFYLRNMVGDENSTIMFTGYCHEGSSGRKLLELKDNSEIELFGESLVRKANVLSTKEFSSHAYADELIHFLFQFEDLGSVTLTHGSSEAKTFFKELAEDMLEVSPSKVSILEADKATNIDSWGFV